MGGDLNAESSLALTLFSDPELVFLNGEPADALATYDKSSYSLTFRTDDED